VTSEIKLDHHHRHTVQQIFQHPASHNIKWREVINLLERLSEVRESHRGGWTCTIDGVITSLGRTRGRDLTAEQVIKVRHLLESRGVTADGHAA
jgi:hypothetical protein